MVLVWGRRQHCLATEAEEGDVARASDSQPKTVEESTICGVF